MNKFDAAVLELEALFITIEAELIDCGYSWYPTSKAPETFEDLKKEADIGFVIPIANYGCNQTIYSSEHMNQLFRFWHDVIHLELNENFQEQGELAVALVHKQQARERGLSQLAIDILWADTYGQVQYYNSFGKFVEDQKDFVKRYIEGYRP